MPDELPDKESEILKMKVTDLKKELKARGLSTEGKKNELVERLQLAVSDSALLDDSGDLEDQDDLLDEDLSDDQLDSELSKEEMNLMENKLGMDTGSSKSVSDSTKSHPKKIILNRNSVITVDTTVTTTDQNNKENGDNKQQKSDNKSQTVKTTEIAQKEKLELRAAKFGVALSSEAKKMARAERFGASTSTPDPVTKTTTVSSVTADKTSTNIDVLKKRAERFGATAPGCPLEKVELEERKKRRLERFGSQTSTTEIVKKLSNVTDPNERKRLRAERFKTS